MGRPSSQSDTPFEQAPLPASPVEYGILVNGFAREGICEVSGKGGVDGIQLREYPVLPVGAFQGCFF